MQLPKECQPDAAEPEMLPIAQEICAAPGSAILFHQGTCERPVACALHSSGAF